VFSPTCELVKIVSFAAIISFAASLPKYLQGIYDNSSIQVEIRAVNKKTEHGKKSSHR